MPVLLCRVFFYLLLSFCTVKASLGATPAYSVDLAAPLTEKEAQNPRLEGVKTRTLHALTLLDAPHYPDGFKHFNYVEVNAPKRGTLRTAEVGTFHNLAPFSIQQSSIQVWLVYEQLFTSPRDDPLSSYPLIAESVEVAEDKSFVIFHLNPMARWQDGLLVTSEDVVFTFNTLRNHDKALPYFRSAYQDVEAAEAIDPHQVKFRLSPNSKNNLPFLIASMHILPAHYYVK